MTAPKYYNTGVLLDTALTGAERVLIDTGGPQTVVTTTAALSTVGAPILVTDLATTTGTLTTAQIGGSGLAPPGIVNVIFTQTNSGITQTTPTVAQMIAAFPNWVVGTSYDLCIINAGTGNNITIGAGTGWVLAGGSAVVANNTWRKFVVALTSATVITATMIQVGTYS